MDDEETPELDVELAFIRIKNTGDLQLIYLRILNFVSHIVYVIATSVFEFLAILGRISIIIWFRIIISPDILMCNAAERVLFYAWFNSVTLPTTVVAIWYIKNWYGFYPKITIGNWLRIMFVLYD